MVATDSAEVELWERYRQDGDTKARDQLFAHYVPWASAIARAVHSRVRAYAVDREDFVQNANMGLLDAMSRYDPSRGIAFSSYAKPRVRGAVFNGLKAILSDRPPPSDKRFAERLESLQSAEGGSVFDDVVGTIVGLSLGYLLDESVHQLVQKPEDAVSFTESAQIETRVAQAVALLPERLQLIIRAHYFEQVPFQQIAIDLGVTKGRVSQLHHSALSKMREILREM